MTYNEFYFKMKEYNTFERRYFFIPLISAFPIYKGLKSAKPENLSVATKIADSVICLPIYADLKEDDVKKIIEIIKE